MLSNDVHVYLNEAFLHLSSAERVMQTTLPLVSDPRLLLVALDSIYETFFSTLKALLVHQMSGHIEGFCEETYDALYPLFCTSFKHYPLDLAYLSVFTSLYDLKELVRTSAIRFPRREVYVLCTEEMATTTLSKEELELFLQKANTFITEVSSLLSYARRPQPSI